VRRDRGELAGPDVRLETKHGAADFAVGDRVQFTDTDKKRHIYNGNAGFITGLDTRTGQVTARLDAAAAAALLHGLGMRAQLPQPRLWFRRCGRRSGVPIPACG